MNKKLKENWFGKIFWIWGEKGQEGDYLGEKDRMERRIVRILNFEASDGLA